MEKVVFSERNFTHLSPPLWECLQNTQNIKNKHSKRKPTVVSKFSLHMQSEVVPLLNNLSYLWLQCSSTVIDCYRDWPLLCQFGDTDHNVGIWSDEKYDLQTQIYWMHSLHTCDVEEEETVL